MAVNRIVVLLTFIFLFGLLAAAQAEDKAASGLIWILPDAGDIKTLKPEDSAQQAKKDGLYDLINGGASVYLSNGFKQAILQDYRSATGTLFNLEVYELDSTVNAKKVFALKGGDSAKPSVIGQSSILEDYYGLFLQGSYYISITASETTKESQELIKQIAKATIKKIQTKGPNPPAKK
jgi:Family of unknown function (DUF6599)